MHDFDIYAVPYEPVLRLRAYVRWPTELSVLISGHLLGGWAKVEEPQQLVRSEITKPKVAQ